MVEEQKITITQTTSVVVLTGAGISAESGLKTFRDKDGLWENYRPEELATPEAFARDPELVWRFYHWRRNQVRSATPNPAHYALVRLEQYLPETNFLLITQNVDNLHQRAGSKKILPMHGEILKVRCTRCDAERYEEGVLPLLPKCHCGGLLRPAVVWFGEQPLFLSQIYAAVERCDIFIAIGSSGVVYPAAGLLSLAKSHGATTIGINKEKPANVLFIDLFFQGNAGELLPKLIYLWTNGKISLS
ncbi:MAG: NAD-dependent deacylase [bacterium]|nr:NAD-dependent deacylase [bacterium]